MDTSVEFYHGGLGALVGADGDIFQIFAIVEVRFTTSQISHRGSYISGARNKSMPSGIAPTLDIHAA